MLSIFVGGSAARIHGIGKSWRKWWAYLQKRPPASIVFDHGADYVI
jgi:hypothetical protein